MACSLTIFSHISWPALPQRVAKLMALSTTEQTRCVHFSYSFLFSHVYKFRPPFFSGYHWVIVCVWQGKVIVPILSNLFEHKGLCTPVNVPHLDVCTNGWLGRTVYNAWRTAYVRERYVGVWWKEGEI